MANGLKKVRTIDEFPNVIDFDSVCYAEIDEIVGYFRRECLLLTYRNGEKSKLFGVSGITSDMIANPTEVVSVIMPDSVVTLGSSVFSDCYNLTHIEMSPNITNISTYAFYNCSSLTSLTIPDSVQSYESNSFNGCSGITELYIGSGITYDNGIFYSITNIEKLTCKAEITLGSGGASLAQIKNTLKSVTVGGNTELGNSAFEGCSGLTELNLLEGISSIGYGCFGGCSGLTSVELPNSLTEIEEVAFGNCKNLTYIDLNQVQYIDRYAFQNCSSLTEIVVPSTLTDAHIYSFANCSSLTNVFYNGQRLRPNMVMWIGANGIKLAIGENVSNFNGSNFRSAGYLSEVDYRSNFMPTYMFSGCINLEKVTFGGETRYISQYAFENCVSLSSITIPSTITDIGANAFSGCTNLTVINYNGPATGYPWGAPLLTE